MATDEGRRRGSGWTRRLAAAGRTRPDDEGDEIAAPEPPAEPVPVSAAPEPGTDDLDVRLRWPERDHADADAADADADTRVRPRHAAAGAEATDLDLDTGEDVASELVPAVPLLPAIAGRIEGLDGQLRALGIRLDALASSIGAVRTAVGDRVDAYADAAAATARQADTALEDHRRSTERAISEVRRGLTSTDEVLRRLEARLDEVATDVASLVGSMPAAAPTPVTTGGADAEVVERLGAIEERLRPVGDRLASVEETLARVGGVERSLGEVRSLVEVVVDTMPSSAEGSGVDIAERVAEAVLARIDVDDIARQVAERLEERFEVVVEPGS